MTDNHFQDEDDTDVRRGSVRLPIGLFAAIALLIGLDLVEDGRTGAAGVHLSLEAVVMLLALGGLAALWWGRRDARGRVRQLDNALAAARQQATRYRDESREALRGLGAAIDSQFTRWGLTPAEREVGLLLLKGLSHREVADARLTTESTVRQQALSLYRKAGVRNRADLSAFFLEDLLLPHSET